LSGIRKEHAVSEAAATSVLRRTVEESCSQLGPLVRTNLSCSERTSVRDMHKAFHIPHVYDYITKSCRQQAEVVANHENENVRYIGQGEARHRKYKRLKLGDGHVYDCSSD
jgi:hypothetical protein